MASFLSLKLNFTNIFFFLKQGWHVDKVEIRRLKKDGKVLIYVIFLSIIPILEILFKFNLKGILHLLISM
jgi:hypothetical protein